MIAKQEIWKYAKDIKVWVGKYKNSHNLLHWHYDCELLYVEKGSIDIFCAGESYLLREGEILFVDSGKVHSMRAAETDTTLIVIVFDREIVEPYLGDLCLASPRLTGRYPVPKLYETLRGILLGKEPFYGGEAAGHLLSFMSAVYRRERLKPCERQDKTAVRFRELLARISESSELSFKEAAHFMDMSDAYFSRYFHRAAGVPYSAYLNYVRTEKAIALLHGGEDLAMTEIAERSGFNTIRNFNRIFLRLTGYAPSALPSAFTMEERFVYPSEFSFDPTLHDCELIESPTIGNNRSPQE